MRLFERTCEELNGRKTLCSSQFSHPERDVLEVEKRNLLALAKLVVRDVIESSMIQGRMLDSDHVPLQVS
jgi:hypothetical protein